MFFKNSKRKKAVERFNEIISSDICSFDDYIALTELSETFFKNSSAKSFQDLKHSTTGLLLSLLSHNPLNIERGNLQYECRTSSYWKVDALANRSVEAMNIVIEKNVGDELLRNILKHSFAYRVTDIIVDGSNGETLNNYYMSCIALKYRDNPLLRDSELLEYRFIENMISKKDYEMGKLEIYKSTYNETHTHLSQEERDEHLIKYELEAFETMFRSGVITMDEYESRTNTIKGLPWSYFRIFVDSEDPSKWEFGLEHNEHFIEQLVEHGFGLSESIISILEDESETEEDFEENIKAEIIDLWVRKCVTEMAAGMLQDHIDHQGNASNSFKSAMPNTPESYIVENMQIADDDSAFEDFKKTLKKKRAHK